MNCSESLSAANRPIGYLPRRGYMLLPRSRYATPTRREAMRSPTTPPEITPADVREDQATAESLIEIAARLLDEMSPF